MIRINIIPVFLLLLPIYGHSAKSTGSLDSTILVLGDSISAGYGMEKEQGWVALLDNRLKDHDRHYRVVNVSISGDTTEQGLIRLPLALTDYRPRLVIIELGGNDGLRGYPISKIRENMHSMIVQSQATGADVLLVGIMLPPNYGARYTTAFQKIYTDLASRLNVALIPFISEVATDPSMMQRDGIHPKAEAQPILLDSLWSSLIDILDGIAAATP